MPNLEKKQQIVQEIQQKIEDATLVVFTDYRGLNVEEMTSLREKLRVPGVEFKVLKNTMVEFALKNTGHEEIIPQIFGPNAVLFSNEDAVGPVKSIYEFIKQYKKLEVKAGILEGQTIAPDRIKYLADLPPREVLLAQVVGTMQAPITSLAYVLNANLSGLARVIDQIRDQKQAS